MTSQTNSTREFKMGESTVGALSQTGTLGTDAAGSDSVGQARPKRRNLTPRTVDALVAASYPFLVIVVCIGIWQAVVSLTSIKGYLLPSPWHVATSIGSNGSSLLSASVVTSEESVYGFLLATVIGIPLGFLVALTKIGSRGIYPLVVGSNAVPKVAIAPLLVIWFGFGQAPKVLIAFLVAFFPIVVNTVIGVSGIEKEKLFLAETMGMGWFSTLWQIRLPQALPSIFAGLKIATSLAVIGAVVAEFVDANTGLGMILLKAGGNLETSLVFACLVFLTLIGILFFTVIVIIEQLLLPWQRLVTKRDR
jgi:NitT/TauT family transport system permease protein